MLFCNGDKGHDGDDPFIPCNHAGAIVQLIYFKEFTIVIINPSNPIHLNLFEADRDIVHSRLVHSRVCAAGYKAKDTGFVCTRCYKFWCDHQKCTSCKKKRRYLVFYINYLNIFVCSIHTISTIVKG